MKQFALFVMLNLFSWQVGADDFFVTVKAVEVELIDNQYNLSANIDFKLSDIAKEALQNGIPLNWTIRVKVKQKKLIWDQVLNEIAIKYQIQHHALLNLFSVKNFNQGSHEMFSSLTAALNEMSNISRLNVTDRSVIQQEMDCYLVIKVEFNRESLPTPLRPFSYFDAQWALSSDWTIWPLQN